jgi:hypothetical protein
MKETHKVSHYVVDFNELATLTHWNDDALASHFWDGLAPRIKDVIANSREGKPTNLAVLRSVALRVDQNYWERMEEREHDTRKTSSSGSHTNTNKSTGSSSNSRGNSGNLGNSQLRPSGNSGSSSSSVKRPSADSSNDRPSSSAAPNKLRKKVDLTGKLKSDGRLTDEERARRISEGLCTYCGKGKHSVEECSVLKAKEAAKGRAATTTPRSTAPVDEGKN